MKKRFVEGDKSKAICLMCGVTKTTFQLRDLKVENRPDIKDALVGVCDGCGEVLSIPHQTVPQIKGKL